MTTNNDDRESLLQYTQFERLAELAISDIRKRINRAIAELGDRYLVRAELSEVRPKSFPSLKRKAHQRGWTFEQALSRATDLIGFRLVCHNLQDIARVADLIEISLQKDSLNVEREDYIAKPKPDGYQALHLTFRLPVQIGSDQSELGCEIQIRSFLQDSWARLSRVDIYSSDANVPASVRKRMVALSKSLAKADKLADRIRQDITRPRRGRQPQSGQQLTDSAVAFLFRKQFGQEAPEYLVQSLLRELEGRAIRSDGLAAALENDVFLEQLKEAYKSACGWEAEPEELFRWVTLSLVSGTDGAIRLAKREGRAHWEEVDAFVKREILSEIPSAENMLDALENARHDEDPEWSLGSWADVLGGARNCTFCGTIIIDPEEYSEAVVKFYGLKGKKADSTRERLMSAASSIATETGSWDNPNICGHCEYVLNKD